MGLGAIEAIEAAGKVPGKDIKIITVDAVKDGMQALADGKINFIVECNPLLGPQLMDLAKKVKAGETVPSRVRHRGDRRSTRSRRRRRCRAASTDPPVPRDRDGVGRPRRDARPEATARSLHAEAR